MIDIKLIRDNPKYIQQSANAKRVNVDISRILELDKNIRLLKQNIERIATKKNEASKQIPKADKKDRDKLIAEMRAIDVEADGLKERLLPLEDELDTEPEEEP